MTASTRSGLSPFTWITGASMDFATSVQYNPLRALIGVVVKPIWLLVTTWIVPFTSYPSKFYICIYSYTTPYPAIAASPWIIIDIALLTGSLFSRFKFWMALVFPVTSGLTVSKCDGLGSIVNFTVWPFSNSFVNVVPRWYLTSPELPHARSSGSYLF